MGLPSLNIEFKKKAREMIHKSSSGVVLLLLYDTTKEQTIQTYTHISDVAKGDYTEPNYGYISLAFLGNPNKVWVVRGAAREGRLDIEGSKALIENLSYDWLCVPDILENETMEFATWFIKNRKDKKSKCKAVLPNCNANAECIVNFTTDKIKAVLDGKVRSFSTAQYCSRMAGLLAGIPSSESATYKVLDEVVDCKLSQHPDNDIDAGKLILIFDDDKFKVGRGVTSLTEITGEISEDSKKIKIVEAMDLIRTDILKTFKDHYVGKRNNNYDNKQLFIGAILEYFKELEGVVIDSGYSIGLDLERIKKYLKEKNVDIDSMKEIDLKKANTGSFVFLTGNIKPLDAMEDFNLSIHLAES